MAQVPTNQLSDAIEQYGESEDGYTATPGHQVLTGDELSIYYLLLNLEDPVLQDLDLRRALSLAVNREAICETVFEGTREPASGIVPNGVPGYTENMWADSHYDVEAAKEILDAKYPADADGNRGITIDLTYNLDGDHKTVIEMVMADWNAVGIQTTSSTGEWASIITNAYPNGDFQVGRLGWIADYPIYDNFMYPLFFSTSGDNYSQIGDDAIDEALLDARSTIDDEERIAKYQELDAELGEQCWMIPLIVTGGDNNYGKYSNADVDAGMLEARAMLDDAERIAKFQEVDKLVAADMPVIPLFVYKHQLVCSDRVDGLYMDAQKLADLSTCELVEE